MTDAPTPPKACDCAVYESCAICRPNIMRPATPPVEALDVAAIEARLTAITPWPWETDGDDIDNVSAQLVAAEEGTEHDGWEVFRAGDPSEPIGTALIEADARFYAQAPSDIAALLVDRAALLAANVAMRKTLEDARVVVDGVADRYARSLGATSELTYKLHAILSSIDAALTAPVEG